MEVIRWLQSPELVVSFQKYFGLESLEQDEPQKELAALRTKSCSTDLDVDDDCSNRATKDHKSPGLCDRLLGPGMVGDSEHTASAPSPKYRVYNWLWYHYFTLASLTGDEVFYTLFFPFWLWNVDGAVMRRVIVCWMLTMYIGQALKDWLAVPRPPSPPVVQVCSKWALEFGLPSTHATVALVLPTALLVFSVQRYQMSWQWCAAVVLLWSLSVSASRIYLGMHTLLDVVCGALLGLLLLVLLVPTMGALDEALLTRPQAPVVVFCFTLAAVAAYPATATWNPARGDTAVILGVGCGTLIGAWLNFQTGVITPIAPIPPVGPVFSDDPGPTQDLGQAHPDPLDPRYPILWPSGAMVGLAVGRTLLGLLLILLVRCVVRPVAMKALCAAMQVDIEDYLSHNLPSSAQTTASPPAGGAVLPPPCPPVDGSTPPVTPPLEGERALPSPSSQGDCPSVVHCPSQEPHLGQCPLSASPHKGRRPLSRVQHCFIECGYKFLTYICIGLSFSALAPAAFRSLGIERPTFCTEV